MTYESEAGLASEQQCPARVRGLLRTVEKQRKQTPTALTRPISHPAARQRDNIMRWIPRHLRRSLYKRMPSAANSKCCIVRAQYCRQQIRFKFVVQLAGYHIEAPSVELGQRLAGAGLCVLSSLSSAVSVCSSCAMTWFWNRSAMVMFIASLTVSCALSLTQPQAPRNTDGMGCKVLTAPVLQGHTLCLQAYCL